MITEHDPETRPEDQQEVLVRFRFADRVCNLHGRYYADDDLVEDDDCNGRVDWSEVEAWTPVDWVAAADAPAKRTKFRMLGAGQTRAPGSEYRLRLDEADSWHAIAEEDFGALITERDAEVCLYRVRDSDD